MSKKDVIEERAWELLSEEAAARNLIPVDAEYVKQGGEYSLLLYIDKEGGVTVEDCEAVSRAIDPRLDEEDFIPDAYTLYVSSPGLGRPIRRPRDYVFAKGKEVELKLFRAVDGQKEYEGTLMDFDEESATVDIDGKPCRFMKNEISLLRLAFDF
ncbi:MAG: ribosome maturation factor RimP [bacterium]